MNTSTQLELNGARKAAILLVLLGDSAASKICDHLPQDALRALAEEISALGDIPEEIANSVLREYENLSVHKESLAQGGPDFAEKLFPKPAGTDVAKSKVYEIIESTRNSAQALEALQVADNKQLASILAEELPQTVAIVIAHLDGRAAGIVLNLLPDLLRAQAVRRLAEMKPSPPELVSKILSAISRKLQANHVDSTRRGLGGVKVVADLLNKTPGKVTSQILDLIEKDNTELATSIRNQMFTFEDFIKTPDAGIRELLAQLDKKTLATGLKNASEELKAHIFKSMSSRAVEMLKEDTEALGQVRSKDISQAQIEIIASARRLEAEGKMMLRADAEEENV